MKSLVISLFGLCSIGAMAMDQPQHKGLDQDKLLAAIAAVPDQTESWSCGKHQCGHLFKIISDIIGEAIKQLSYEDLEDYPAAVFAPKLLVDGINGLAKYKIIQEGIPASACDRHGRFIVGAAPAQMERYINEKLPEEYGLSAQAISQDRMNPEEFIKVVENNLSHNLPTLVYYVMSSADKTMHYYAIVGIDYTTRNFQVLDTSGEGMGRVKDMNIDSFIKNMNAQSIIDFAKTFNKDIIRSIAVSQGGKLLSSEDLAAWKAFSAIKFVPKEW